MGHHDLFFKKTFSIRENAINYLRHVLPPELAEGIDYATVAFEKDSHVDAKLAEYFSDTETVVNSISEIKRKRRRTCHVNRGKT